VNLVSSKPRVSKLEFFVALALVALAQAGKGIHAFCFCNFMFLCEADQCVQMLASSKWQL
jgi:hypothetical protein